VPDRPTRLAPVLAHVLAAATLTLAAPEAGLVSAAHAQPSTSESVEQRAASLLDDFAHFVFIRNDELATANAQALLDLGLTPTEFVAIVEDNPRLRERFEETARRALVIDAVEPAAAELRALYEEGQLERARDPQQVAKNIQLLTDNPRARMIGRERLAFAGEYAVPQLLQVLMARADQVLESEVQRLLIEMGPKAVMPLAAALPKVDLETQRRIATIMGQAEVRAALPYLYEVYEQQDLPRDARRVVDRAINRIDGGPRSGVTAASLFLDLAESFYREQASLTQFQGEDHQLVWDYDPGYGLSPVPVRTEVYHEMMAMRLAEHAAELGASQSASADVWLAANFSREIDSPAEYENPLYTDDRRGATFYAVAAGPTLTAGVLERGLRDRDTPLIRRAIAALTCTSGGEGGWRNNPLADALAYPDRRVQYEAALAIAEARPSTGFPAAERVVPTLAAAIRQATERFALVIAADLDARQTLAERLREQGYTVLPPAASLADAQPAIAEAPGVDLVASQLSAAATEELLTAVRAENKLRVAPVLAAVAGAPARDLASRYNRSDLVSVVRAGLSPQQYAEAARQLAARAAGDPLTDADAQEYAARALAALRDLAVAGSSTLDVAAAARPLTAAFQEGGPLALVLADVLARLDDPAAQRALLTAALESEGPDRIAQLRLVTRSVRDHGAMLENRQVDRLVALSRDADLSEEEAVAVAALVGSLDLDAGRGGPGAVLGG